MDQSIVLALLLSCLPAIFGTTGMMILYVAVLSLPLARARTQILRELNIPFVTEARVEMEMARKHPYLYYARLYSSAVLVITLILIYVISFFVIRHLS